jgi:hypothetical protein
MQEGQREREIKKQEEKHTSWRDEETKRAENDG